MKKSKGKSVANDVLYEHLRVEENPILKMPHLEAVSILLVGPTLKKSNDRFDLSREEGSACQTLCCTHSLVHKKWLGVLLSRPSHRFNISVFA